MMISSRGNRSRSKRSDSGCGWGCTGDEKTGSSWGSSSKTKESSKSGWGSSSGAEKKNESSKSSWGSSSAKPESSNASWGSSSGGEKKTESSNASWGSSSGGKNKTKSSNAGWGSSSKKSQSSNSGWGSSSGVEKKNESSKSNWGSSSAKTKSSNAGWGSSSGEKKKTESSNAGWGSSCKNTDSSNAGWGSSSKNTDSSNARWGSSSGADKKTESSNSSWGSSENKSGESSWGATTEAPSSAWGQSTSSDNYDSKPIETMRGTCLRWNSERGFGFIKPDDGSEGVFCHASGIIDGDALKEGASVTFELVMDERKGKPRAENVKGGVEEDRNSQQQSTSRRGGITQGVCVSWRGGFGFIKPDSGGTNVFCHATQVQDGEELVEGERYEFEMVPHEKGSRALRARVVGSRGRGSRGDGRRGRSRSRSREQQSYRNDDYGDESRKRTSGGWVDGNNNDERRNTSPSFGLRDAAPVHGCGRGIDATNPAWMTQMESNRRHGGDLQNPLSSRESFSSNGRERGFNASQPAWMSSRGGDPQNNRINANNYSPPPKQQQSNYDFAPPGQQPPMQQGYVSNYRFQQQQARSVSPTHSYIKPINNHTMMPTMSGSSSSFCSILDTECKLTTVRGTVATVRLEQIGGGETIFGQMLSLYPIVDLSVENRASFKTPHLWLPKKNDRVMFNIRCTRPDEWENTKRYSERLKRHREGRAGVVSFGSHQADARGQDLFLIPAGTFARGVLHETDPNAVGAVKIDLFLAIASK